MEETFRDLRFTRSVRRVPNGLVVAAVTVVVFTLLWWVVPRAELYWILAPTMVLAVWVASFGWRDALVAVHDFIHRLEEM